VTKHERAARETRILPLPLVAAASPHHSLFYAALGNDPSAVNATLVEELFSLADVDQILTIQAVAQHRRNREQHSKQTNPSFVFSPYLQLVTYAEVSAFLIGVSNADTASISVDRARSFLVEERIPDGFQKSATPVSTAASMLVAVQLKLRALFSPSSMPSTRLSPLAQ
jgi:hypothetical protein